MGMIPLRLPIFLLLFCCFVVLLCCCVVRRVAHSPFRLSLD